jgi:hypothetical protein
MSPDELQPLIEAHLNQTASDEQTARLQDLLRANPEARRIYRQYICVESAMHDLASAESGLAAVHPATVPTHTARYRPWMAWAAALALLASIAGTWFYQQKSDSPSVSGPGIAVLTRLVDVQWKPGQTPLQAGSTLGPGRIAIAGGLAQLEFLSGALVVLEGPAELELVSPERAVCKEGRLRSNVPPQAHGFTVAIPGMDVVDLGTEFALSVAPGSDHQVHVLSGEVRLQPATGAPASLYAGQALLLSKTAPPSTIPADPSAFAGPAEIATRARDRRGILRERWAQEHSRINSLPGLLAYYDFERGESWSRILSNRLKSPHAEKLDGAVIGCEWVAGRFPGKGALEFKRTSDRVRVDIPGQYQSLTFSAWVRIEGWDRWLSSLLLTDVFGTGSVHWQLSDKGELILGVRSKRLENHFSPPVISPRDLGRWVHLATTIDQQSKLVTHYLDGRTVGQTPVDQVVPLQIGPAEIGNWRPARNQSQEHFRSLNGRIDELALFSRALAPSEIHALYENGLPHN